MGKEERRRVVLVTNFDTYGTDLVPLSVTSGCKSKVCERTNHTPCVSDTL